MYGKKLKDLMTEEAYNEWRRKHKENSPHTPCTEEHKEYLSKIFKGSGGPMYGKDPWCKGQTKENNIRLKEAGEKISKTKRQKEAKWMNNGKITKLVPKPEQQNYLNNDFVFGR